MKKLLFIIAFIFVGQQASSQIYVVSLINQLQCQSYEYTLLKINPSGTSSSTCVSKSPINGLPLIVQELNSIVNQGYKLIEITNSPINNSGAGGGIMESSGSVFTLGTTWYFAVPWSASGLEEVATTLKSFIINPNPANTFVDVSIDYSLKGESEVVFISEAGYIAHKENINNIYKNEKYNIDTSKIPSGKYLVTIVNGKTYTTPQKLIIF